MPEYLLAVEIADAIAQKQAAFEVDMASLMRCSVRPFVAGMPRYL